VILSVGLTPAYQQIVQLARFEPGEVNRAREVQWCASGKILNVGIALTRLGAEHRVLSLGGGPHWKAMEDELAALQVPGHWLLTTRATRVCTTLLIDGQEAATEIVENAPPISESSLRAFGSLFAEEISPAKFLILTGSLPPGTLGTWYRDLLAQTSARALLDIRGPELLAALECKPFVVKPNRQELAATLGRELRTEEDLFAAMEELCQRGAEWAVITQGRQAVLALSRTARFRVRAAHVPTVNPIGCGDCFLAGLAWALQAGEAFDSALRLAVAAAADNARQLLPARLDPAYVRELAAQLECTAL